MRSKVLLIAFVAFNIWHATNRGIWVPMSAMNSLRLSKATAEVFRSQNPNLRAGDFASDSQQMFIMAHDPFIRKKTFLGLMDYPNYEYRRILYPWLCRLLIFGNEPWYPYVFLLVNLGAFTCGGFVVWKIVQMNQWTSWVVLAYFTNTGLLYSSFNDFTECLSLFLIILGLFCWLKKREAFAVIFFALSALTREQFVIVPVSIIAWDYIDRRKSFREALGLIALVGGPLMMWVLYIQYRLPGGAFSVVPLWAPPSFGLGRFSLPFVALWQEALWGAHHLTTHTELKRTLSLAVEAVLMIVIGFYGFLKRRSFWSWNVMTQGIFVSMLRGDIWNYHLGSARVIIPLGFLFSAWCADDMKVFNEKSIGDAGSPKVP